MSHYALNVDLLKRQQRKKRCNKIFSRVWIKLWINRRLLTMAEILKGVCQCKDCAEKRENREKHLAHHFYQDANEYREQVRTGQIIKGSEKYPEPFNPDHWTPQELLKHAMQENVDQAHYIYGLFAKIESMQREMERLKDIEILYKREMAMQSSLVKYLMHAHGDVGNAGEHGVDVAIKVMEKQRQEIIKSKTGRDEKVVALKNYMVRHFYNDFALELENPVDGAIHLLKKFRILQETIKQVNDAREKIKGKLIDERG